MQAATIIFGNDLYGDPHLLVAFTITCKAVPCTSWIDYSRRFVCFILRRFVCWSVLIWLHGTQFGPVWIYIYFFMMSLIERHNINKILITMCQVEDSSTLYSCMRSWDLSAVVLSHDNQSKSRESEAKFLSLSIDWTITVDINTLLSSLLCFYYGSSPLYLLLFWYIAKLYSIV